MASAKSQRLAAAWNTQFLRDMQREAKTDMKVAADTGVTVLWDAGNRAKQDLVDSMVPAQSYMTAGYEQSRQDVASGFDRARATVAGATDGFKPYLDAGTRALETYEDSLGLRGPKANDRAVANFRASPGYRFQVDEATDAVARKASAMGVLGSGNTMTAVTDRAANLADGEWGDWQGKLQGLTAQGMAAQGQVQSGATQMAGLDTGRGTALAGLATGWGKGLSDLYAGQGKNLASVETMRGGKAADVYASQIGPTAGLAGTIGGKIADGVMGAAAASDAARNANANLPMQIFGTLLGGIGSFAKGF